MAERLPKDFNEVLYHINEIKKDKDFDWMDAIKEYCEQFDVRIEEVGFLIKENKSFLTIIEKDFIQNKHLKPDRESKIFKPSQLEDWGE